MRNIFVEGIQGSGKSTLVNKVSKADSKLQVCREGDYSPIDLACALSYTIRPITSQEYSLLDHFLYEAIFIPEGVEAPPKDIIKAPELQVYVESFGERDGDICLVAEVSGRVAGAVWVRIMDDYGHVEDGVPSFAISLYKEYRGHGIGTELMKKMLVELRTRGYKKASLAVQKENYAVRMYKKVGFEIIDENDEEYIMMWRAKSNL